MANVVEEQRILPDLPVVEDCDAVIMDDDDDPCGGAGGRAVTMAELCVIMPDLATVASAVDEEADQVSISAGASGAPTKAIGKFLICVCH